MINIVYQIIWFHAPLTENFLIFIFRLSHIPSSCKSLKIEKDADKTLEISSQYGDFKDVNGILFPFKMAIIQGEMSFNIKVTSLIIKDKVDLKTFK